MQWSDDHIKEANHGSSQLVVESLLWAANVGITCHEPAIVTASEVILEGAIDRVGYKK